jgi:Ferritin-like domain
VVSDEEPASRRQLLRAGAASAAIVTAELLSACGSSSRTHVGRIPQPVRETDVGYLNHALDLKHYAVGAYTAATPLLKGRAHAAAKRFLGQDLSHVSELMGLITRADGTPNQPQQTYDLGHPRGAHGILRLLDAAENAVIAGFLELLPNVAPGAVRGILASIIANDAQHVVVLRLALRRNPIPAALMSGHE